MKASLELLGKVKKGRKIAILGDMLELGRFSKKIHKELGDVVVDNDIDILITIGKYSEEIDKQAIELGMAKKNVVHFDKEDDSYDYLRKNLDKKDVVLVKGSHGIHLENIVNKIMKF